MSLPKVPELPASKTKFFLYLKPFKPNPSITQKLLLNLILTPSFFRQFKVFITSSESNRFEYLHFFEDCDYNKAHLIDKLLSPSIIKLFLNP